VGGLFDGGVEKSGEEDFGNGLFQGGECLIEIGSHALDILPFGLEGLRKACVGCLRVSAGNFRESMNSFNPLFDFGVNTVQ
jgi:hypothetical protein